MKRIIPVLLLALALLAGCTSPGTAVSPAPSSAIEAQYPIQVTDLASRNVKIEKAPQKIVSLTASNTEMLCAMGLEDKLVGVDDYSDYPESVKNIEKVGAYSQPNYEKILSLAPDIVLAGNKLQKDTIAKLEEIGVTVISAEARNMSEYYASIELIGKSCGAAEKAAEMVSSYKLREQAVTAQVKDLDKPSVYYVLSYGEYGDYTCGKGSFMLELITLAGGDCISKDSSVEWPSYSVEKILEQDPDILICPSDSVYDLDAFRKTNGYKDLSAVKNNKLTVIDGNLLSRPGPRMIDGLETLAKLLHESK